MAEHGCQLVRISSFVNVDKFGYRSDQLKCYMENLSFWSVNIYQDQSILISHGPHFIFAIIP